MRRIAAHRVFTPGGMVERGVVTVDHDGRVVAVEVPRELDAEAGVEFYSGILIPGLVNAHCHLELSHLRGLIPAGCGFAGFVEAMKAAPRVDKRIGEDTEINLRSEQPSGNRHCEREQSVLARALPSREEECEANARDERNEGAYTDVRDRATNERNEASGLLSPQIFWDARMWSEGVAAVADICNGTSTFEVKRRSPIFYHSFREVFGFNATIPDGAYNITPHSLYSLTPEIFAKLIAGNLLSVHFLESTFEVADPAAELVRRVPADRAILLIHNCLATQRDIDIVMGHFRAPVTWVVCPRSNRYISGLRPPIDLLRRNGLRIAIGTDSPASNETLSMAAEMAEFPDVPLEELLGWATLNGAHALGLDHELGSIEVGKRPGLAILSGGEIKRIL